MALRCNLIIMQGMDISSNIHDAYQWTFFLVVSRPRSFRHLIYYLFFLLDPAVHMHLLVTTHLFEHFPTALAVEQPASPSKSLPLRSSMQEPRRLLGR